MNTTWRKVLRAAAESIRTANSLPSRKARKQAMLDLRPRLPYYLHEVHPTEGQTFIWLNREYKPLGQGDGWVDYQDFPLLHVKKDNPVAALGRGSLFSGYCQPWDNKRNADRLCRLIDLLVAPDIDQLKAELVSLANPHRGKDRKPNITLPDTLFQIGTTL